MATLSFNCFTRSSKCIGLAEAVLLMVGNANEKVLPLPTSLSSQILPPWCSTISLQIGRPRPVPFGLSVSVSPPTCLNCSNTAPKSSDAMPMPVSIILTTISFFFFDTLQVIEPLSVNFTELEIRLIITCISLSLSPVMSGRLSSICLISFKDF